MKDEGGEETVKDFCTMNGKPFAEAPLLGVDGLQ